MNISIRRLRSIVSLLARKVLWEYVVIAAIVAILIMLALIIRSNTIEPSTNDNAKIGWFQMCRDGQCRPAAVLSGRIPYDTNPLIAALKTRPDIKVLCLHSPGGNNRGGAKFAIWIQEQSYETCLSLFDGADEPAQCASACTTIFVAGQRRTMTPTAKFQIHSGALEVPDWLHGVVGDRLPEPVNVVASRFASWFLVKPAATQASVRLESEALRTPSDRLSTVTPAVLLEWGVLTEPAGPEIIIKPSSSSRPG